MPDTPPSHTVLRDIFRRSLEDFLRREPACIRDDVSERNFCQRWSIGLQSLVDEAIPGWYVDAEYNRMRNACVKVMIVNMETVSICCDLLVHRRGEEGGHDNLIAIEVKKSWVPAADKEEDRIRLRALTTPDGGAVWSEDGGALPEHVCGYRLGYFVETSLRAVTVEEFVDGRSTGHFTIELPA